MDKKKKQLTRFLTGLAEPTNTKQTKKSEGETWKDRRFTKKGYLFQPSLTPVLMFPGYDLPKELTNTEVGRCLTCAYYLEPETNMLFYRSNQEHKPLKRERLAKRLGISYRQCCRFIQRMVDYNVMAVEEGRIYICPVYFFRGKHIRYALYSRFKDQLDKALPQWVIDRFNGKDDGEIDPGTIVL